MGGRAEIGDQSCDHLSYHQEVVDWEIWLGPERHFPCQLKITYKKDPGQPSTTVTFHGMETSQVTDDTFAAKIPDGYQRIKDHAPCDRQRSQGRGGAIRSRAAEGPRATEEEVVGEVRFQETVMVNHTATDCPVRRSRAFRAAAAAVSALVVLTTVELSADRRSSGGSVRQSNNTSRNTGANRDNNDDRNTNANRDTNANRNTNVNNNVNRNTNVNNNVNVNRNTNVNVNRNVNANAGVYGRPGGVAVGEEGAVAVGRRGAVAATDEGFVGVGRHGAVVGGERYESYEGWKVAAGVATGIAVGTARLRPPAASVMVQEVEEVTMHVDDDDDEQVVFSRVSSLVINVCIL